MLDSELSFKSRAQAPWNSRRQYSRFVLEVRSIFASEAMPLGRRSRFIGVPQGDVFPGQKTLNGAQMPKMLTLINGPTPNGWTRSAEANQRVFAELD